MGTFNIENITCLWGLAVIGLLLILWFLFQMLIKFTTPSSKLFSRKRHHKKNEHEEEEKSDSTEQVDQEPCSHEWEYHFFSPDGYNVCKKCGRVQ